MAVQTDNKSRNYTFRVIVSAIALLMISGSVTAADAGPVIRKNHPDMIDAKTLKAIKAGSRYLARTQGNDGSWLSAGGYGGSYPIVMTSLCGLALMAGGSTPESGPYSRNVLHALNYILNVAESNIQSGDKKILITAGSRGMGMRSMYGHGFGMLFLAQCYGVEKSAARSKRIKRILDGAVMLTSTSQSDMGPASKNAGGWTYSPTSNSDEGSVTVTQLQALRACRNAGIKVPISTIKRTVHYLKLMQQSDGGICYSSRSRGSSQPAISAAAIACFYAAGIYDRGSKEHTEEGKMVERLLQYCKNRISVNGGSGHYFYTHFYMAQGFYQKGGKDWKDYYPAIRDRLTSTQMPDGNWNGDHVGPVYGTAIGLIILQLPYGRLPVIQQQ